MSGALTREGEAILHGFIAALFTEALLRTWQVEDSDQRVRLRLLALGLSLVLPPLLRLFAPFRGEVCGSSRAGRSSPSGAGASSGSTA